MGSEMAITLDCGPAKSRLRSVSRLPSGQPTRLCYLNKLMGTRLVPALRLRVIEGMDKA